MSDRGFITTEYVVWCGDCGTTSRTPREKSMKVFRLQGWNDTAERGWLCPCCFDRHRGRGTKLARSSGACLFCGGLLGEGERCVNCGAQHADS